MEPKEGPIGVSLREICGYLTGVLTCSLDSLSAINVSCSMLPCERGLLAGAMDISGIGYARAKYDKSKDTDSYNMRVLRDAGSIKIASSRSADDVLPDILYYELRVILEVHGKSLMPVNDLIRAIGTLPYEISSAFFDVQKGMHEVLYVVRRDMYWVDDQRMLSAASINRDSRYIELLASLMDPAYRPFTPGELRQRVYGSMVPHSRRSEIRICALARRFLDPRALLLSTLGCTAIIVKEALRDPQKYGIRTVLDKYVFDEYIRSCVLTGTYCEGGPVADNMRDLLSIYPRDAVVVQLERYLCSTLYYGKISVVQRELSITMILQGLLDSCSPYEIQLIPKKMLYDNALYVPPWDEVSPYSLSRENFFKRLVQIRGVPGITLSPDLKYALASFVMEQICYRVLAVGFDEASENLAANFLGVAGPSDKEWLVGILWTLRPFSDTDQFSRVIDIMLGKNQRGLTPLDVRPFASIHY